MISRPAVARGIWALRCCRQPRTPGRLAPHALLWRCGIHSSTTSGSAAAGGGGSGANGGGAVPSAAADALAPSRWQAMRKSAGRALALLGAGAVTSSVLTMVARYQASRAERALPDEYVLEVDLSKLKLVEAAVVSPLAQLSGQAANQVELRKAVSALKAAAADTRCRGLIAIIGNREHLGGTAMVQELRAALDDFRRKAGARAPVVAWSPAFGEAGTAGTIPYYLATACDKVYMQPSGIVGLTGLESVNVFVRDLLDKLKVRPIIFTREDFKTAAHMFTQRDFTPQHRENITALLQSLSGQMWRGIAERRGLTPEGVATAVNAAPLLPRPALEAHRLLDGLQYKDEVVASYTKSEEFMKKEQAKRDALSTKITSAGKRPKPVDRRLTRVPLTRFIMLQELKEAAQSTGWLSATPWEGLKRLVGRGGEEEEAAGAGGAPAADKALGVPAGSKGLPKVAVITAVGPIVQGPVQPGPGQPPNRQMIDAAKLSAELESLADAEDVRAVVLRISSPGGSALGSDTLHHALCRLKAAGKPLVVSMGDVAASGGMFLAAAGDKIVAQPGTLTGSIGVVMGKFNVKEMLGEVGANPTSIKIGDNADILSPFTALSPAQETHINVMMDAVYDDFLQKVAAGRGRSVEEIRPLAGGRVYTGEQALEVGLVDALGGLQDAVRMAKAAAALPEDPSKVVVFDYPPKKIPMIVRLIKALGPLPGAESLRGGATMDSAAFDSITSPSSSASSGGTPGGMGAVLGGASQLLESLSGGITGAAGAVPGAQLLHSAATAAAPQAAGAAGAAGSVTPLLASAAITAVASANPAVRGVLAAVDSAVAQAALIADGSVQMYSMEAEALSKCG